MNPPTLSSQIEANWLWEFLQKTKSEKKLIDRAKEISGMTAIEKRELTLWVQKVSNITTQFLPNPGAWPTCKPSIPLRKWSAYKELMIAFYDKALLSGLPYQPDGTSIARGGVTYASFVQDF